MKPTPLTAPKAAGVVVVVVVRASLYQTQGIDKSPIYERYVGGPRALDPQEPRRFAFLDVITRSDGKGVGYRFVIDDAVESLATLPKVRALLKQSRPND